MDYTGDLDHDPLSLSLDVFADSSAEQETDPYRVVLDAKNHPKNFPLWKKWFIIASVMIGSSCVNAASSMPAFIELEIMSQFHVTQVSSILGVSLFVLGLALGPLVIGPFSEVLGRHSAYQLSLTTFWLFTWPLAFKSTWSVYLFFRFVTGFCGSAVLVISGAVLGDMFENKDIALPMAVGCLGPFAGPVLGPVIGGFISEHLYWVWVFRLFLIWTFVLIVAWEFLVPETYELTLLKRLAAKKRKEMCDDRYYSPLEKKNESLSRVLYLSIFTPFQLMAYERMALFLNLWCGLISGVLYLAFQMFPILFVEVHDFNMQDTGLTFIGMGFGMVLGVLYTPLTKKIRDAIMIKYNFKPPPEIALKMGQLGAILIPISLFWLAFTTYRSVHWIVPVIASVPFGTGMFFAFTSTWTYMVIAFRPVAASALASNSFTRSLFGAALPLASTTMYSRLGLVGGTALLAGLSTLMAPLPFIIERYGMQMRQSSRFAVKS